MQKIINNYRIFCHLHIYTKLCLVDILSISQSAYQYREKNWQFIPSYKIKPNKPSWNKLLHPFPINISSYLISFPTN